MAGPFDHFKSALDANVQEALSLSADSPFASDLQYTLLLTAIAGTEAQVRRLSFHCNATIFESIPKRGTQKDYVSDAEIIKSSELPVETLKSVVSHLRGVQARKLSFHADDSSSSSSDLPLAPRFERLMNRIGITTAAAAAEAAEAADDSISVERRLMECLYVQAVGQVQKGGDPYMYADMHPGGVGGDPRAEGVRRLHHERVAQPGRPDGGLGHQVQLLVRRAGA